MTPEEYSLQRHGTAAAFRDPSVQNAISVIEGGVAVSVMQWGGPDEQEISLYWTTLHDGHDVARMADVIEQLGDPFDTRTGTAIGNSLRAARTHLATGPQECTRSVIDISGDGSSNTGIPVVPEADALLEDGTTINALVLPSISWHSEVDPFLFYSHYVARAPDSFVIDVASYEDYWRALKMKLLRELNLFVASSEQ